MKDKSWHILTAPRSGSKVLQRLLVLVTMFKHGQVCSVREMAHLSLGEYLMFEQLRHWAFADGEGEPLSGRAWNMHSQVPDVPVHRYDIVRLSPGRYAMQKVAHSYMKRVPPQAFLERVNELLQSSVPWVVKSFPMQMSSAMRLDRELVAEQIRALNEVSTPVALIRRNAAHVCISQYLMAHMGFSSRRMLKARLAEMQTGPAPVAIPQHWIDSCRMELESLLTRIMALGCHRYVYLEDLAADPAGVILSLANLQEEPDVEGLRFAIAAVVAQGREGEAFLDYPALIVNYDQVVAAFSQYATLIEPAPVS